jgi:hypothetical protein
LEEKIVGSGSGGINFVDDKVSGTMEVRYRKRRRNI